MRIRGKALVPRLISHGMRRQPESADKLLKFNLPGITQTTVIECAT